MNIALTVSEANLRSLLLNVTKDLQVVRPDAKPVTMRLAGGWVRDKLLQRDSDDLDIALDTMSGFEFATEINRYLERHGLHLHKLAKIVSNPDKSKHLETATMRIEDLDVDFVNLRSETYLENSRIPVVAFGTPYEDAMRRDITINALFYNLHTQQVEDLTEKGLSDLKSGLIRTPLPPRQTFEEDPLRILRVIRFASRLGYFINEDIIEAARDKSIKRAFDTKISRERVGIEIEKIWNGPDGLRGMRILEEFEFYWNVFTPPNDEIQVSSIESIRTLYACHWLMSSQKWLSQIVPPSFYAHFGPTQTRILNLTATLSPFGSTTFIDKKKRTINVAKWVVLNSVKLSNHEAELAEISLNSIESVRQMVNTYSITPHQVNRSIVGNLIRKIGNRVLLENWPVVMILAAASDIMAFLPNQQLVSGGSACAQRVDFSNMNDRFDHVKDSAGVVEETLRKYTRFMQYIVNEDLQRVYEWRPLLNGKEVAQILNIKPGPHMGAIMEKLMDWQLSLGPDIFIAEENVGSSPGDAAASAVSYTPRPHVLEECRAWLKSTFQ